MDSDTFLWQSKSKPGQLHRTTLRDGVWYCSCRAGRKGNCWHLKVLRQLHDCGNMTEITKWYGVRANWI